MAGGHDNNDGPTPDFNGLSWIFAETGKIVGYTVAVLVVVIAIACCIKSCRRRCQRTADRRGLSTDGGYGTFSTAGTPLGHQPLTDEHAALAAVLGGDHANDRDHGYS